MSISIARSGRSGAEAGCCSTLLAPAADMSQARPRPNTVAAAPLAVAVVGAGPSGLILAAALRRRGMLATVFEKAPGPSDLICGAGVNLMQPAASVLQAEGMWEAVTACNAPSSLFTFRDAARHAFPAQAPPNLVDPSCPPAPRTHCPPGCLPTSIDAGRTPTRLSPPLPFRPPPR